MVAQAFEEESQSEYLGYCQLFRLKMTEISLHRS
ncbi:hypothetical protein NC651_037512 [Populus alba x Populus x berolinensis]|nr:hypothetical protein NC651_037512 [Populus alba x Populus x berolinensis]